MNGLANKQQIGTRLQAIITALAAGIALLSSISPTAAQQIAIPAEPKDEIPRALRAALAASARGLIHGVGSEESLETVRAEALAEFNKQLEFIAPRVDDGILKALNADSGPDVETVLLAIARDRAARPEAYATLLGEYGKEAFDERAIRNDGEAARLAPPYDTAEWRLAWEYMLLAPSSGPVSRSTRSNGTLPLRALEAIGNEASLPVIMHRFRIALASAQCNPNDPIECQALMRVVAKFPSRRGVEAMLECVTLLDAYQETIGQHIRMRATKKQSYREYALGLLSKPKSTLAARRTPSWEKAVREFPTAELSKRDRDLIEAAVASYAEPAK